MKKGFCYENLKKILKSRSVSQIAFYHQLKENGFNVGKDSYKQYLIGVRDPSSANIQIIAELLNISIDDLFYKDSPKKLEFKEEYEMNISVKKELAKLIISKCNKYKITPSEYVNGVLISKI